MNVFTDKRLSKRILKNHLPLAIACLLATALLYWFIGFWLNATEPKSFYFRLSMATGDVALVLLVATLSIGTINILGGKSNPISSDWRRDLGIWCGIFALIHFIAGWNVHMQSRWQYFFTDQRTIRIDAFGFANYTGLVAMLIVVVLLAISNDFSLRWLKAKRWKAIQRWNYGFAVLVVAHTILYQILENRPPSLIVPVMLFIVFGLVIQIVGFRQFKEG